MIVELSNDNLSTLGTWLEASCAAAADFGVEFQGLTSAIDSADTLIAAIADHFGFDPTTGADL